MRGIGGSEVLGVGVNFDRINLSIVSFVGYTSPSSEMFSSLFFAIASLRLTAERRCTTCCSSSMAFWAMLSGLHCVL
jgi:hypothetical protein